MHYPSEFQTGGPESVEPDIFLSLPPMLLAGIVGLLILAALLGWFGRDWFVPREPDATETIWQAINAVCKSAIAANSDTLLVHGKALRDEIRNRLDPVLTLSDGINKPLKELDTAIKGKIRNPSAAATPPHVTVMQNNHIVVNRDQPAGAGAAEPSPPPPPVDRDMTDEERADHLRRAIGRFHDHWSQKPQRLAELGKARRALCHTAPLKTLRGH
tara:strand:+ start:1764 stop:2408 length:645 start_codon:yes stop_codon:yes gene_type:complete